MHNHPQVAGTGRTPRWIKGLWFVVVGLVFVTLAPAAQATNHDHGDPRLHNRYIHTSVTGQAEGDEDFCTQVVSGTLYAPAMRDVVNDALLSQPARWDGAASWKLDFYRTASDCNLYSDQSWIEFQYLSYATQTGNKWCGDGISCTSHFNVVTTGSHRDYRNEVMYMEQDHVDAIDYTSRTLVSHETGHAIGYRDPVGSNPCPAAETPSIMHIPYYGCSDPGSGPTSKDLNVFTNHLVPTAD